MAPMQLGCNDWNVPISFASILGMCSRLMRQRRGQLVKLLQQGADLCHLQMCSRLLKGLLLLDKAAGTVCCTR